MGLYVPKPRRPNSFSEMGGWEWIYVLHTLDEQVAGWHHSVDMKGQMWSLTWMEGVLGLVSVPLSRPCINLAFGPE